MEKLKKLKNRIKDQLICSGVDRLTINSVLSTIDDSFILYGVKISISKHLMEMCEMRDIISAEEKRATLSMAAKMLKNKMFEIERRRDKTGIHVSRIEIHVLK